MILEFRIPLPLKTEEFQVAQLFMVATASEKVTGGGEGVEVVKNEPYLGFTVALRNFVVLIILMVIWV